jgi:hypothetical protein
MRDLLRAWNSASPLKKSGLTLAVALIAALHILAALRLPVGVFNDDAANVLLAKSLAHGSYAFPGGLGAPEEYLPAFPLFLALPAALVEPNWGLLRAIPLAFLALSLLLAWRLARRFLSPEASAAVVLLVAVNPVLVGFGGLVLPYLPYLALSLALIDAADAGGDRRSLLWLAAGAGLAPLLRPQGVVLIGCLALAQWHRRGLRRAAVFLALALVPAFAWTARNHLRAGSSLDYVDTWHKQIIAVANVPLFDRAANLISTIFGGSFLLLPGAAASFPRVAAGTAALALAIFGARRLLDRKKDSRTFVLVSYVAGLAFLHMTWIWVDLRYTILFVPLIWILVAAAADRILGDRRALQIALLGIMIVLTLPSGLSRARLGLSGAAEYEPETMAWIRKSTAPSARLVSLKNYTVALLAGRACGKQTFPGADAWLGQARRDGVDYLHVVLPAPGDEFVVSELADEPDLARRLDARPEAATQVYRSEPENALVYRIAKP